MELKFLRVDLSFFWIAAVKLSSDRVRQKKDGGIVKRTKGLEKKKINTELSCLCCVLSSGENP